MARTRTLGVLALLAAAAAIALLARTAPPKEADAVAVGSAPDATAGTVDASLSPPGAPCTARAREDGHEVQTSTEGESRTALSIVVRRKSSGAPIPRAPVWVFGDELRNFAADEEGRVVVDVAPGSVSVGAGPPAGSSLLAHPYDPETGEPSAETDVEVESGTTCEVELFLHEGATITGHVRAADGSPVPDFEFVWMHGVRQQWSRPTSARTDENGRFVVRPLEASWYLLSPRPDGDDVFPFERFELAEGATRDVTLRLAPGRLATVRVEVVQEESGEPYPYMAWATIVRADGIADVAVDRTESWERRGWTSVPPIEFKRELRVATYRVTAERDRSWHYQNDATLVARDWNRSAFVEVTEDLEDPVVRFEVPRLGPIAEVHGRLTRPIPGERATLFAKYQDLDGLHQIVPLYPDAVDGAFRLDVDLDVVKAARFVFEQRNENGRRVLAERELQEGAQEITLTPIDE
ncbi:MAG: carboxypeptidase-like regulatory domain-containing protein [Planctomycetota bacterium]